MRNTVVKILVVFVFFIYLSGCIPKNVKTNESTDNRHSEVITDEQIEWDALTSEIPEEKIKKATEPENNNDSSGNTEMYGKDEEIKNTDFETEVLENSNSEAVLGDAAVGSGGEIEWE